ncbi:16S rRNA (cytosine(1402)-N(4))-methyltransferase RsmH [Candidatus Falkowbacteria bacterium]|nr:16S rRNA (cytosine(1402)-N(4))-methyltransferase RsmH [Candidatus Falkowbacteria bacterium]
MSIVHEPVLLREVLEYLNPQPGQNFIDGTFGGGGHGLTILERIKPDGVLIGIDWDPNAVQDSQNKNLILINDNYRNLKNIFNQVKNDQGISNISGILLDLGLSSDQLGVGDRGFSFQGKGFLDLRYNKNSQTLTGAEILKTYNQQELFKLFKEYGEEPLSWPIAKKIIAERQMGRTVETADMLVQLVSGIYRRNFKSRSRRNPATRVFQALRVAVNDEFGNLRSVLPQAIEILARSGRLAVISFHSGEDRIVKNFFRNESKKEQPLIKILTKKPIVASENEIQANPRSRSAKLRVAEKL